MKSRKKRDYSPILEQLWEFYGGELIGADRGLWRKAKCALPKHDDRNASASINTDEGAWYCHTCDVGGDAITLIMEVTDVGYSAAFLVADQALDAGGTSVPRGAGRDDSFLPRRSGHRPGRGNWTPPWKGI